MTANVIVHSDIKGKKLYYVKISNGSLEHFINIGEKTYQAILDLEKQIDLPFENPLAEPLNKKKGGS